MISTGTETASMQSGGAAPVDAAADERVPELYLLEEHALPPPSLWQLEASARMVASSGASIVETSAAEYAYALLSPLIEIDPTDRHLFTVRVRRHDGNVSCGILAADGSTWLCIQSHPYPHPEMAFRLYLDAAPGEKRDVRIVISNHRPGAAAPSRFEALSASHASWAPAPGAAPAPARGEGDVVGREAWGWKSAVKSLLERWTGEKNSRAEQALRRWHSLLTGRAGAEARASIVTADGLPLSEMPHQGWNLGYSSAGEVIAVGSEVRDVAPGDLVACAGAGMANHAEFVSVPVNLVARLPASVDCRAGCSATVGAIALQGVRRAELQLGDKVVVIGLGLIGQLTAQLAKAGGARVYGFDLDAERVARARARAIDDGTAVEAEIVSLVRRVTGGHGADAVILTAASKSDGPINLAMRLARRRGRVVVSGDVDLHPHRQDFYQKEIDLRMATSYGPGRYDATYELEGRDYPFPYVRWTARRNLESFLDLVASGAVDVTGLIDAEFPVAQAPGAYRELMQIGRRPLAVLLSYPDDGAAPLRDAMGRPAPFAHRATALELKGGLPLREGARNVVLVGAGAFAQSMLAPRLLEQPELFQIYGVVSRRGVPGSNFARTLGVGRIASELDPFLADPAVDAVVIATRHNEHAGQALRALEAGKHVFVEKPLAITREQLEELTSGIDRLVAAERPVLLVGFNRRFSPAVSKLREALASRRGPMMLSYRVNAGFIPADHWVQGPEGGGRNLGEACHMYDVLRSLTGAPVIGVRAAGIGERPAGTLGNDNFIATIEYADGSIAQLTYTALGPGAGFPKERLEVFAEGAAFVLDDYCRLSQTGRSEPLWEGSVDKGHAEEMRRFGEALRKGDGDPIPLDEILETTALALRIEELIHGR